MVRLTAALIALGSVSAAPQDTAQEALKQSCHGCHGAGQTFGRLDLTTRDGVLKGGTRGPAIVPGKAADSLLIRVLEGGEPAMPPGGAAKRLPAETIGAIREWIDRGAVWPGSEASKTWKYEAKDLWAFRPLTKQRAASTGESAVDKFIDQQLAQRGIRPAPPASRRDLIRRVTYDLTGLPPSIEEIDQFVNDRDPDAYRHLVDRLLESPRYGEKWARHWLDITRYGDSDGFSNDHERPHAWRYRDYVIRSFNEDKPYDRFVMEQVAGDELDPANVDNLIAVGFLRMGPWEHTSMSVAAVTRQQWLDDVTHGVATTFLGLTFGCARCHDHKFDPIPTADYYSLQAVFASTHHEDRPAAFRAGENLGSPAERQRLTELMDWVKGQRVYWRDQAEERAAARAGRALTDAEKKEARGKLLNLEPHEVEIERNFSKRESVYAHALKRDQPFAYSVRTGTAEETKILAGGNLQAAGATVLPAVPSAAGLPSPLPEAAAGRRLALARWLTRPDNPLTARVMVNRIWGYHFGKALAANTNNFGKMGKKPTHPELLDYLANYFIEHGWSVKAMHRLMLLSNAYQRAAEHPDRQRVDELDPENDLRSYFPPRRLAAEELRDSLLAVTGELSESRGGVGTFAEINEDVANQPVFIMGQLAPIWRPSLTRADRHRRTIYMHRKRGIPDPFLDMFNQPNENDSCEHRDSTTVPMQVFALFNAEFPREMALALAARIVDSPDPVRELFRGILRREPSSEELRDYGAFVRSQTAALAGQPVPARRTAVLTEREIVGESNGLKVKVPEEQAAATYQENLHPGDTTPAVRALASAATVLLNSNEFLHVY